MTDNEIIKALQCCITPAPLRCNKCTYLGNSFSCRSTDLKKDALDLINRQKAEIINRTEEYNDMLHQRNKVEEALELKTMDVNSLESERDALQEMVKEQKAEVERLRKETSQTIESIRKLARDTIRDTKSEAIKEFAERYEKEIETSPNMNIHVKFALLRYARQIKDNLLKEMVGDDK